MVNIQHSSSVVVVYIRLLYIYMCVCVCSFPYHLHVKGKRRQTARKWKERNCYEEPDSPASPMFLGAGRRIGASQPTAGLMWRRSHISQKGAQRAWRKNYPERRIKRAPAPGSWCMRLLLLFSFYRFSHSAPSPRGTFQIYKNRNCTDFRSRTQVKYIWFWRGWICIHVQEEEQSKKRKSNFKIMGGCVGGGGGSRGELLKWEISYAASYRRVEEGEIGD